MDKLPVVVTVSITMDGFMLCIDEGDSDGLLVGNILKDGEMLGCIEGMLLGRADSLGCKESMLLG